MESILHGLLIASYIQVVNILYIRNTQYSLRNLSAYGVHIGL